MASVLFVCLGNICRSPTAHGVFRQMVQDRGLETQIHIDSAGTGGWHVGSEPDNRAQAAARRRGYELSDLRARQVSLSDFERFDYVLAMDKDNLRDLQRQAPAVYHEKIRLFLSYRDDGSIAEVPDPYYGGEQGFNHVLDLVEEASAALLDTIAARL